LTDVDGTNDHYPYWWGLHGEKELAAIPLDEATFALAQALLNILSHGVASNPFIPNEALFARFDVGHEHGGTPSRSLCIQIG
jgi:hypothetical protein